MPDLVTPESSPVRRPEVAGVDIEGEMVLFDETNRLLHRLNPTATAIWVCLDGTGTLSEIAVDLAEVFGAPLEQVLADVLATVGTFAEQGLIEGSDEPIPDEPDYAEADPDAPFVLEPPAPCSGASGPQFTVAIRAGSHLLGLCCSTVELANAARRVFKPRAVEGADPPDNLSVVATRARSGRSVLWCYRSNRLIGRHRGLRRAMQSLASLMTSYEPLPRIMTRMSSLLVIKDGRAVLLSSDAYNVGGRLMPKLRGAGWQVHDAPWIGVDGLSGEVVVPSWTVEVDEAALDELPSDPADLEPPTPGIYPVVAWVEFDSSGGSDSTKAGRVARAARDALDIHSDPVGVLGAVESMLERAAWMTVRDDRDVIPVLQQFAGRL